MCAGGRWSLVPRVWWCVFRCVCIGMFVMVWPAFFFLFALALFCVCNEWCEDTSHGLYSVSNVSVCVFVVTSNVWGCVVCGCCLSLSVGCVWWHVGGSIPLSGGIFLYQCCVMVCVCPSRFSWLKICFFLKSGSGGSLVFFLFVNFFKTKALV